MAVVLYGSGGSARFGRAPQSQKYTILTAQMGIAAGRSGPFGGGGNLPVRELTEDIFAVEIQALGTNAVDSGQRVQ